MENMDRIKKQQKKRFLYVRGIVENRPVEGDLPKVGSRIKLTKIVVLVRYSERIKYEEGIFLVLSREIHFTRLMRLETNYNEITSIRNADFIVRLYEYEYVKENDCAYL